MGQFRHKNVAVNSESAVYDLAPAVDASEIASFLVQLKNLLNGFFKQAGNFEGQRQTRIVFFRFNCVHGLARNFQFVGQIGLRPFLRRTQFAQYIFHL